MNRATRYRKNAAAISAYWRLLAVAVTIILASGCASTIVKTKAFTQVEWKQNALNEPGITYFLPKQLYSFEFKRELVDLAKLEKAQNKAVKDLTEATAQESASKKDFANKSEIYQRIEKDQKVSNEEKAKRKAARDGAKVTHNYHEYLLAKSRVALEQATVALTDAKNKKFSDTIKVKAQPMIADHSNVFVATLPHRKSRDETFDISTNEQGLLQGFAGDVDDKSDEIIVELAALAGTIGLQPATPNYTLQSAFVPPIPEITEALPVDPRKPFSYKRLFDPSDDSALTEITNDLSKKHAHYKLHWQDQQDPTISTRRDDHADKQPGANGITDDDGDGQNLSKDSKPSYPDKNGIAQYDRRSYNGLVYRRTVSRLLLVKHCSTQISTSCDYVDSMSISSPNQGPVALLDLQASPFVRSQYGVKFKDGMLTNLTSTRPSEISEGIRIPVRMLRALFTIPTELVQLKVNLGASEAALVDAQAQLIQSQLSLLQSESDIANFKPILQPDDILEEMEDEAQ